MVVDAEVDENVGQRRVAAVALHDEQRRGLLPPTVSAGRLRGGKRLEQPFREGAPRVRLERVGERVDGLARDQDVALRGVALPGPVPRPVEAA